MRRLRRETRILREEREILKKARPSSRRRATRPAEGLRVCGAREGRSPRQASVRVLGVASSGYCAWHQHGCSARAQVDARLSARIGALHAASRQTYGVPRIHAALAAEGTRCGRKRVARLMRQAGLVGCHRRRPFHTTQRDPLAELAPDLVQRQFVASAPNQLWIADITSVPTRYEDFLYLAVVLDVFSRRVVGWAMAAHLRAELVVAALEMAVWNRL